MKTIGLILSLSMLASAALAASPEVTNADNAAIEGGPTATNTAIFYLYGAYDLCPKADLATINADNAAVEGGPTATGTCPGGSNDPFKVDRQPSGVGAG